ncbi:hypothetical protein [Pontibacter amylolyticus]|uniref:RHS repeat protein n=1 Tax=Pontibacter amylolyticus TaxID=1424080 RepID=A0ABQ1W953_9BACT|nr:hypothetical protein [Pontibacter amylolyticus]GGG19000.1 hypothetical protein GCM10011323_23920 [Pontibacter amylolyticus]
MKTKLVKLLLLFLITVTGHAQNIQDEETAKAQFGIHVQGKLPNLQSPNAAGLGLYGEVPVSHFTGVPNIQIPIYSLNEGHIQLPITLSYHASGVRPDAHPGWVGMGWSLMVGGVITRTVNDVNDEYHSTNAKYPYYRDNVGYYYTHGVLKGDNWNSLDNMEAIAKDPEKVYRDTEPDEFSFNFLHYSGKFYLNHDGKWQVRCDQPVKVKLHETVPLLNVPFKPPVHSFHNSYEYPQTFGGFTITAEDGTEYIFGGTEEAIEYSMDFFDQKYGTWVANAWYLTKIRKNGREINLKYERDNFINQLLLTYNINLSTKEEKPDKIFDLTSSCMGWGSPIKSYDGKLIAPVYLSVVEGGTGKLIFERSVSHELRYNDQIYVDQFEERKRLNGGVETADYFFPVLMTGDISKGEQDYELNKYLESLDKLQWKKLDRIKLIKDGESLREFLFTYNNSTQAKPEERLTLLSFTEIGRSGAAKPGYSFRYHHVDKPLPPYLAGQVDHWGFYNERNQNFNKLDEYYDSRASSNIPSVFLRGTLSKIIYPTGGETTFEFEQHAYGKQLSEDRSQVQNTDNGYPGEAGGLRIKKITNTSPESPNGNLVTEYFYVSGYTNASEANALGSSGILGGQSKYYFVDYRLKSYNEANTWYVRSFFSSQSQLPVSANSQGSHIGYSEVIEKRADGSYSQYLFTNFDFDNRLDEVTPLNQTLQPLARSPYKPYTSLEEERGKLRVKKDFTDTDVLVRAKEIEYVALNKSNEFVRSLKAALIAPCGGIGIIEGTPYRFYTYSYLPIRETETVFDANGLRPITTVKNYTYNNHRLLTKQSFTDSKGSIRQTEYTYPVDYAVGDLATADERVHAIKKMQDLNMVASTIEETQWEITNGAKALLGANLHLYRDFGTEQGGVQLEQLQRISTLAPVPQAGFVRAGVDLNSAFVKDQRYQAEVTIGGYNRQGNLLMITKEHSAPISYLWGYNYTYPIAEVRNATFDQVKNALGGEEAVSVLAGSATLSEEQLASLKRLSEQLPDAMISIYTYDPLVGMTSLTDMNGKSAFYEYDSFGRLWLVRDLEGNILKAYEYNYRR